MPSITCDIAVANTTTTPAKCNGASTGSTTITMSGSGSTYQYSVNSGALSAASNLNPFTISGLPAGTHTINIINNLNCSTSVQVTITQPAALTATTTVTAPSTLNGNNGSINICVNGGTAPYTVTSTPAAVVSTTQAGCAANFTISGLTAGTYNFTITDANGCTFSGNAVVPSITCDIAVANTTTTPAKCNGASTGSTTITMSGSGSTYQYSVNSGALSAASNLNPFTITGLPAGTHTINIINNLNCSTSVQVTITQPAALTATTTVTAPSTLNGNNGSINICVNGGTAPYTVTSTPAAVVSTTQAGCAANFTISGLTAGTYNFTITDANGCTFSGNAVVPPITCDIAVANTTTTPAKCNGTSTGSTTITMSGSGTTYQYSVNSGALSAASNANPFTISGLPAGTHIINIINNLNCSTSVQVSITQPDSSPSIQTTTTNPSVVGGSDGQICITGIGGTPPYTFTATCGTVIVGAGSCGGTHNISGLSAGVPCEIKITDANGCETTTTVTLVNPECSNFQLLGVGIKNNSCAGSNDGTITISVSGGTPPYTYTIGNNTFMTNATNHTFGPFAAGTYNDISVTDSKGCKVSFAGTAQINDASEIRLSTTTTAACGTSTSGGIDLTVSGGTPNYSYIWSNGTTTQDLTNLAAGSYSVTVTDDNGCQKSLSVSVAGGSPTINGNVTAACGSSNNTGAIDITVTPAGGDYSYLWSNGSTSEDVVNLAGGVSYTVTVTDRVTGCRSAQTFTIQNVNLSAQVQTKNTCDGMNEGSITLTPSGGSGTYSYNWSPNVGNTNNPQGLGNGNYNVTITDQASGCSIVQSINIEELPAPSVTASASDEDIINGQSTNLSATATGGTSPYTYSWSPSGAITQNTTVSPTVTTTYTVKVTDVNGCMATDIIEIRVEDKEFIKMPTAFTPNGNVDVNTSYGPVTNLPSERIRTFKIFNRWGQVIFDDPQSKWNGTFQSADQPIGTYVYMLEYLDSSGEKQLLKGHFNLIR